MKKTICKGNVYLRSNCQFIKFLHDDNYDIICGFACVVVGSMDFNAFIRNIRLFLLGVYP